MPLPNNAFKLADEKKFKSLAAPITSYSPGLCTFDLAKLACSPHPPSVTLVGGSALV